MAASNSDDSSRAPDNFNISSSNDDDDDIEDDGSHLEYNKEKCPLCATHKKSFHCRNCVRNGDFVHSTNHNLAERFADKQLKYAHFKMANGLHEKRCVLLLQKKFLEENLRSEIKRKKESIQTINRLLVDVKQRAIEKTQLRADLVASNMEWKKKLPKYCENVRKLSVCVEDRLDDTRKSEQEYKDLRDQLKQLIRMHVQKLTTHIFPIHEVRSKCNAMDAHGVPSTVTAIAEAAATCHVSGKWVVQDTHSNELQHVIVAPSLPGNGSYLAYNDWVATNKDGVSNAGHSDMLSSANPAYKISAALTYTAQLVHLLSFYLDVRLPYKVVYGDFCKKELNEQQFTRKVARLNADILYLCYTQGVDLSQLDPTHTLENIQHLLNDGTSELGRFGAVDVHDTVARKMDSYLVRDLQAGEDSESDDDNSLPNEWEAVPHLPAHEYGQPSIHNMAQNPQHSASLMTSAAATIASFWRGFTTK